MSCVEITHACRGWNVIYISYAETTHGWRCYAMKGLMDEGMLYDGGMLCRDNSWMGMSCKFG